MKTTIKNLKALIEVTVSNDDAEQYLDALEAQLAAEQAGDDDAARIAAHRAASLFFVMDPKVQTIASREAQRRGLA